LEDVGIKYAARVKKSGDEQGEVDKCCFTAQKLGEQTAEKSNGVGSD
jgi:hypothetical protein